MLPSDFDITEIHDDSNQKILNILRDGLNLESADSYYKANYHPDFSDQSRNVFNLIARGRYSEGGYYIVTNKGQYVASGGWYPYEDIIIALSRANIARPYKNQPVLGDVILPKILIKAQATNKKVWMTFNENNKVIYDGFLRAQKNLAPILGQPWPNTFRKFRPVGTKTINNFVQFVVEYDPAEDVA